MAGIDYYETPPTLFKDLDSEFHFTLDAASEHHNALVDKHCTRQGTFINTTKISEKSGLSYNWQDETVFCNPPYTASTLYRWVERGYAREANTSVFLLPPSTSVEWFHDFILQPEGTYLASYEAEYGNIVWRGWTTEYIDVLFSKGRPKFLLGGIPIINPPSGILLVVFRR